jgi:hypothetical protein
MLLCLRLVSEGRRQKAEGSKQKADGSGRRLLPSAFCLLPSSDSAPSAVAWVALSLLPLPGAALLPFPADRFSLAGLLLTSLALDWHSGGAGKVEQSTTRVSANVALLLAVVAPLAGGRSLLQGEAGWGLSGWLSTAAVAASLVGLLAGCPRGPAASVRWLAWLGLGATPVWASLGLTLPGPAWAWVSVAYLAAMLALAGVGRAGYIRERPWLPAATCWGLGALSALAALLR